MRNTVWLSAVLMIVSMSAFASGPNQPRPESLINKESGRCLDVGGNSMNNGGPIVQFTCHGMGNQQFLISQDAEGYYVIQGAASRKCLDVPGFSVNRGAAMQQWDCHGGINQQFYMVRNDDRTVTFVGRQSNLCLGIDSATTDKGARLITWDCDGSDSQRFFRFEMRLR